jgi:hypothetical protein
MSTVADSSASISSTRHNTDLEKNYSLDPEKDVPSEDAPLDQVNDSPTPVNNVQDPEKGSALQNLPADPTDWNGPDDPANPMNWSKWKRGLHVVPPAIISFTG